MPKHLQEKKNPTPIYRLSYVLTTWTLELQMFRVIIYKVWHLHITKKSQKNCFFNKWKHLFPFHHATQQRRFSGSLGGVQVAFSSHSLGEAISGVPDCRGLVTWCHSWGSAVFLLSWTDAAWCCDTEAWALVEGDGTQPLNTPTPGVA